MSILSHTPMGKALQQQQDDLMRSLANAQQRLLEEAEWFAEHERRKKLGLEPVEVLHLSPQITVVGELPAP